MALRSILSKNTIAKSVGLGLRLGHVRGLKTLSLPDLPYGYGALEPEGGGEPPKGTLAEAIDKQFISLGKLIEKINGEGAALQGSGWVWLAFDKELGRLAVETTLNQLLGSDILVHSDQGLDLDIVYFSFDGRLSCREKFLKRYSSAKKYIGKMQIKNEKGCKFLPAPAKFLQKEKDMSSEEIELSSTSFISDNSSRPGLSKSKGKAIIMSEPVGEAIIGEVEVNTMFKRKGRKKTSSVWDFFVDVTLANGTKKVKCKLRNAILNKIKGSTITQFLRH
ncbi:hypothetical protein RJ639_016496 [Escallonia herrerae]|uniref:superoxide dismutase n=1 Tax=Escallonia herrerae TaxID=1293975 RepID=A0AA89AN82_9ASTE|nr:hypothetical protein RJ639_016496 [Escallonia herrerae]